MANHQFLVAATSSGCGKTTISLGIMRELTRKGYAVQPFKCGPDYIDTQFHTTATGNESVNLDIFMSSQSHVKDLFHQFSYGKEVAIVEGVMGMFDGFSRQAGSSAELSEILSLPIVLVVNGASTAYSVAATVFGFKHFNPNINVVGIIFNRVSSESHFTILKDACKDAGAECLGYLKKDEALTVPSRHLGLTLTEKNEMECFINSAADAVKANVDIEKLLELTANNSAADKIRSREIMPSKRAAVACDEAFNFIYRANLMRLRELGYEIIKFSPIHDPKLPAADFVYLPGGYPELYKRQISDNKEMMRSIRDYAEKGGKMWAECGGLIYLTENIDNVPMCGIFPLKCSMEGAKLRLGYREIRIGECVFRGHEFHYSHLLNPAEIKTVGIQLNSRGGAVDTPIYRYKNVFASYTHLYWGDNDIFKLWRE